MTPLAPFPWPGGKSRCADVVWTALGSNVPNYVEPFAGSLAVLLSRPGGAGKIETVNDKDAALTNFWRAIQYAPEKVAKWCDWPVSELDLRARHQWIVDRLDALRAELEADPGAFDPQLAGWWVWGVCQWIGGGWCRPNQEGRLLQKRPAVAAAGGVHLHPSRLPGIANDRGIFGVQASPCREWFLALQERLKRVRVVCGDWHRVLGDGTLGKGNTVGGRRPCAVFLDPPYRTDDRDPYLYAHDDRGTWEQARDWAVEHGQDPELRIALCGYEGVEMPEGWTVYAWRGARGYAGKDNHNRERERIWFSPFCLPLRAMTQRELFEEVG